MLSVRRGLDGCYWIPRHDKETEDYLDSQYIRATNQLKWFNKISNIITTFKNIYQGRICQIVGKGPSLDYIKKENFDSDSVIICINESVHQIESLNLPNDIYVTQLDSTLKETCRPKLAKMFLNQQCSNLYEERVVKYIVDPMSFGLQEGCISAQFAIMLARHMGCTTLDLLCFDGCNSSNFEYAKCIGYSSTVGGPLERFKSQRSLILEVGKNMPLKWSTPRADGTTAYIENAT